LYPACLYSILVALGLFLLSRLLAGSIKIGATGLMMTVDDIIDQTARSKFEYSLSNMPG
jgi:hypothetical protein